MGQKSCCTTIRNTIIIKSYRAAKYTAGFPNHKDQQIGEIYEIKKSIRTDFIIRRSSRRTLQADRREAYPARRKASAGERTDPGHGSEKRTESLSKNLERYSMLEAYEVRQVLEVKGVELIIRNASEEDIDDLEKAYKKVEHTYETTGTTTGEFELHKLYAEKTGSMFMTQTLDLVLNAILDMMYGQFYDVLEATSEKQELESHRQIIDAIRRRDTEAAQRLMHEHLQVTMDMLKEDTICFKK